MLVVDKELLYAVMNLSMLSSANFSWFCDCCITLPKAYYMVVFFLFVFVYFSQRVIVAELRNDCEHSG